MVFWLDTQLCAAGRQGSDAFALCLGHAIIFPLHRAGQAGSAARPNRPGFRRACPEATRTVAKSGIVTSQGTTGRLSGYNPLDLFSGEPGRVTAALCSS